MSIVAEVGRAKDGRLILRTPGMSGLLKGAGYKEGDKVEIRRSNGRAAAVAAR